MLEKEKWFYFAGGKSASDLDELIVCLREIPNEEFSFHVNGGKNDFANWVEGVFGESELADKMRHVMERKDTIDLIKRHVHFKKKDAENDMREATSNLIKELVEQPAPPEDESAAVENLKAIQSAVDASVESELVHVNTEAGAIDVATERDLKAAELKEIAYDAKQELLLEERKIEPKEKSHAAPPKLDANQKFIVKDFIYGLIMGLVFGLMMLGAMFQLRC